MSEIVKLEPVSGNTQKLDGGAMYGNVPKELWAKWSPPDEKNRITLACRALLATLEDGRHVLFEAGIGAFFDPKMKERFGVVEGSHVLLENLKASGLCPEDLDVVVLSHLHFDHAGGLLSAHGEGDPRLVFPNARYYVGAEHWQRALSPHARDRASFVPVLNGLLERSGRLTLVGSDGNSDLAPLITFRFSHGHTPGLMLSRLRLPAGPLVFAADLIPGLPWVHVPITMGYDRYPELLINEKEDLLAELAKAGGKVFFTHDPQTPCAVILKDEKGRYRGEPVPVASLV